MTYDEYVEFKSKEEGIGKKTIKNYFEYEKVIHNTSLEGVIYDEAGNCNEDYVYGQAMYKTIDPVWEAECWEMIAKLEYLKENNTKEYNKYRKELKKLFADYAKNYTKDSAA